MFGLLAGVDGNDHDGGGHVSPAPSLRSDPPTGNHAAAAAAAAAAAGVNCTHCYSITFNVSTPMLDGGTVRGAEGQRSRTCTSRRLIGRASCASPPVDSVRATHAAADACCRTSYNRRERMSTPIAAILLLTTASESLFKPRSHRTITELNCCGPHWFSSVIVRCERAVA